MVSSEAVIAIIVSVVVIFALISVGVFVYIFVYKKRQKENILKNTKFPILASPQNFHRELSFGGKSPLKLDIYIVRKEEGGGDIPTDIEESFANKLETRVVRDLPPLPSPPPPPPLHLRYMELKRGVIVFCVPLGHDGKIPDDDLKEFKNITKSYLNYHVIYAIVSSNSNSNIHQVIHEAGKEELSLPPPTPLPPSTIGLNSQPTKNEDGIGVGNGDLVLEMGSENEKKQNEQEEEEDEESSSSSSSGGDEESNIGASKYTFNSDGSKRLIKYIIPTSPGGQVQWDQCQQLVEDLKVLMVRRKIRQGQSSIDLVSSGAQS